MSHNNVETSTEQRWSSILGIMLVAALVGPLAVIQWELRSRVGVHLSADLVTALLTGLQAFAALVLVGVTIWYELSAKRQAEQAKEQVDASHEQTKELRQQVAISQEQIIQSYLPFPVIEGDHFLPKAVFEGTVLIDHVITPGGKPVQARNLGRGPVLYMQWEYQGSVGGGFRDLFSWRDTNPMHVPVQEARELWNPQGAATVATSAGTTGLATLWYDDTFGNHYRCVYERIGQGWQERCRQRIPSRPTMKPS